MKRFYLDFRGLRLVNLAGEAADLSFAAFFLAGLIELALIP